MRPNLLERRRWAPVTRRPRFRPIVEMLETRVVPSVVDYSAGFAGATNLTFNGTANISGSNAQLTNGNLGEAGSFFTNSTFDITQFTTTFTFNQTKVAGNPTFADGLTFTIQASPSGPAALGANGEGLGYEGIPNSVAIKFDLYDNAGEGNNSTGIFTDGRDPTVRQAGLPSPFPDLSVSMDGSGVSLQSQDLMQVTLAYDGSTLTETVKDTVTGATFTQAYSVNIASMIGSNTAYLGFTGATGGLGTSVQNIQTWQGTFGPPTTLLPTISSLSPNSIQAGSSSFILTVNGSNFVSGATVQWTATNGVTTPLLTTFVSSSQLLANVPSPLLTMAGTASVTVTQVFNGNFVISNPATFTITPFPVTGPMISSLSPSSVQAGSSGFTLIVNGSNFVPGATVQWAANGATFSLPTNFISSSQLSANVPSSLVAAVGTTSVTVTEVLNGSLATSNPAAFTILSTAFPVITSLSPSSVPAGSGSFTLTVNGFGFVPGALVQWTANGTTTTLGTTFLSINGSVQLLASVPSSLVTTPGNASITVTEVVNGSTLISNPFTFSITSVSPFVPAITSLSPPSVPAGSGSFTLTVNGSGFVAGAQVQWNQNGVTTTLTPFSVSSSQLMVPVPFYLITTANAGTVTVTVTEVLNGTLVTSNPATFAITPFPTVAPFITSLSPTSVPTGSGSFTLTVNGSGFVSGAVVQWTENGATTTLTPILLSSNQLQVVVPASLLTTAGTASVTVTQVVNGGTLTSNAAAFTVTPISPTLIATGLNITATVNVAQDFTVAQFTDSGPDAQTGAYAVAINFGDGTPVQAGRVTQPGGSGTPFFVDATHTYTQTGTFTVLVQIFKESGAFAQTTSTATVSAGGGAASVEPLGLHPLLGTIGVGTMELGSPLTARPSKAATPLPIQSSTSAQSGQPSAAEDLYWQLVGRAAPNDWVSDTPASPLEGRTI